MHGFKTPEAGSENFRFPGSASSELNFFMTEIFTN